MSAISTGTNNFNITGDTPVKNVTKTEEAKATPMIISRENQAEARGNIADKFVKAVTSTPGATVLTGVLVGIKNPFIGTGIVLGGAASAAIHAIRNNGSEGHKTPEKPLTTQEKAKSIAIGAGIIATGAVVAGTKVNPLAGILIGTVGADHIIDTLRK